jgi:hypothetical protein
LPRRSCGGMGRLDVLAPPVACCRAASVSAHKILNIPS